MFRAIYLVARRDYLGYVTAWGFWLGLLITPVLLGVGMMAPALAASQTPVRYFTVIDTQGAFLAAIEAELRESEVNAARSIARGIDLIGDDIGAESRFNTAIENGLSPEAALDAAVPVGMPSVSLPVPDFQIVDPPERTLDGLRPFLSGTTPLQTEAGPQTLFAALIVTPDGIEYWSESVTVNGVKNLARRAARNMARDSVFSSQGVSIDIFDTVRDATPSVLEKRLREDREASSEVTFADRAPFIVTIGLSFLLWTLIFSVVNYLLMGTIEERSNKIFDTLLTSVKIPHLLAGKLIAVLAVSLTLMSVWSLGGMAVTIAGVQALPSDAREMVDALIASALSPGILIPALISFFLGYLIYGAIFLALGSLCDTIQEAQTLMTPILVLLMIPLFVAVVAMSDPESPILAVMTWIPLFTPFLLILRIPTEPPLMEILAQLGFMALTTVFILWAAARVYRAGAVHGAGVNDALAWITRRKPKSID